MQLIRLTSTALVIGLLVASAPLAALAAPAIEPATQTNLLTNGSFESFAGGVATGWSKWYLPGSGCGATEPAAQQASTSLDSRRVKDGSSAQQLITPVTGVGVTGFSFTGGMQQTVNVTAGRTYRFTVWAHAWSSEGDNPAVSESTGAVNIKAGIGQGATFAADPNVTWSGLNNFKDTYGQITVDIVAAGSQLTVFTSANPASCARHTEVFFDAATLVEVGTSATAAPTSAPAKPSSTPLTIPTNFPTPTPNSEGKIIYTVQPGDSIVHICEVIGRGTDITCIDDIMKMNGLSSKVLSVGQQLIIGTSGGVVIQPTTAPTTAPTADAGATTEPTPTTDPAAATALPAETQASAPTQVVAAAGAASICVTLYNDANGNGVLDAGEGLVAGGNFALLDLGASTTVATYVTDGASEPHCFENLPSGNYRVTSASPDGYTATTRADWDLTLAAGSTANLEFGAQGSDGGGGTTSTSNDDNSATITRALLAAAGVVLLLIAAGVAGFLVLTRRR